MKTKITFFKTALFFAVLFFTSYSSAQTLEAQYKFDGDFNDASGNNRTLTVNGWVLDTDISFNTTSPKVGTHFLDFTTTDNGTATGFFLRTEDGAATTVAAPTSITGNNARTITAWIKIDDASSVHSIAGLGSTATNERFDLTITKNTGLIRCEKAGTGFNGTAVADGTWTFVAISYEQGTATLWVGAQSVATADWSDIATNADGPIMVANGAQSNRSFYGGLDDVRFYAGALTETQLTTVMSGGTLGVNDISFGADELKVYPNMVKDYLNIQTSVSEKLEVTVYNILGKIVERASGKQVDMHNLSSGLYIVKIRAGNKVASLKVIKE